MNDLYKIFIPVFTQNNFFTQNTTSDTKLIGLFSQKRSNTIIKPITVTMTNPLFQEVQEVVQVVQQRNPHEVAVHRRYNAFMLNLYGFSRCHANAFNAQYNYHGWIAKEHFVPDIVKYFGMEIPKGDTLSITMNPFNLDKTGEK